MKKVVLIDAYAMMFRSFYAVRFSPIYKGISLNAVYGCATTIMQAIERFEPDSLVIAFDAPEKTFRHQADSDYKAQRSETPEEFLVQIPYVFKLVEAFNIPQFIKPGFEADDIIGTLAKRAEAKKLETYIMSGDLDFLQLTSSYVQLAKFNGKEPLIFDREMTIAKLGVNPEQVVDYKAICGDSSDNYKGIPGIGPKGASKLLQDYGTLQNIYEHLDELPEKLKDKFTEHKDYAFHCQYLAQIHLDVPVVFDFEEHYELPKEQVAKFFEEINFPSLVNRVKNLGLKSNTEAKHVHKPEIQTKNLEPQMRLF